MKPAAERTSFPFPLVVALAALAVVGAGALYRFGPSAAWLPKCPLHTLSGLHCPGCGMTRATHAMLHGDPLAAFRFNPLVMLLLPTGLAAWALRWKIGAKTAWALAAAVLAFGILRNIPAWPFTLLAPP